ncbi:MAG: gfo/Idh/MocA family oxidoreductase, partial [Erysipelotrichaceae bacterium]|nr:gfo/Idh/MocA family oxidoreductase [Erysipelotrichaceae bacterium]
TVYYKDAKKLIDYANKHDLILFEAIPTAYNPYYLKAVEEVKTLGDIRLVACNYSQYSRRYDRFKKGEILPAFDKKLAGGALLDLGVYNVRFVIGMFGKPRKVVYHPNVEKGVDTSGILVLDYGKFKATCVAAKDCKAESYCVIEGEKGYLRNNTTASRCADFTKRYNNGEEERFFQEKRGEFDSWKYEQAEFIRLFKEKDLECAKAYNRLTLIEAKVLDEALKSAGLNY